MVFSEHQKSLSNHDGLGKPSRSEDVQGNKNSFVNEHWDSLLPAGCFDGCGITPRMGKKYVFVPVVNIFFDHFSHSKCSRQ